MSEAERKTQRQRAFFSQPPLDAGIAALATRQHVVFSLQQLREIGLTAPTIRRRAATGRLHRIHQGVYSLVPRELLTCEGRWMAAVLACGPGAVLSHRAAATLHGLLDSNPVKIDVTVPGRVRRRHPGIALHTSTNLTPEDVTTVDNIPCTSIARTLFDLAEAVPRRRSERALDQAEILEVYDATALDDQIARNPTRPAAAILTAILETHHAGDTVTWNDLEEEFYAICRSAGVPKPQVNQFLDLGDGEPAIRPDFMWREPLLVVEVDGHQTHKTRRAFEQDRRKDQRLTLAAIPHFRTTHKQMKYRRGDVEQLLVSMLRPREGRS
jgi:hypothetical protein